MNSSLSHTEKITAAPTAQITQGSLNFIAISLILTLLYQFRFPGQSYPDSGILQVSLLLAINLVTLFLRMRFNAFTKLSLFSPAVFSGAFLLYAFIRWLIEKTPFWGLNTLSLWFIAALWYCAVSNFLALYRHTGKDFYHSKSIKVFGGIVGLISLSSSLYGVFQYFVQYDEFRIQLLKEIGARQPTDTELGLLHHFSIKRVASVWGDPNILALISAIGVIWGISINVFKSSLNFSFPRFTHLLSYMTIIASLWAIWLSGSRGGLLDVVLAIGFILLLRFGKNRAQIAFPTIIGMIILITPLKPAIAEPTVQSDRTSESWFQRSDTIRERVNYYKIAGEMIKRNFVFGLGPGAVEGYFGQLKSPDTRESKFIHNWPLQIWAETGIFGFLLILLFLSSVVRIIWIKRKIFYGSSLWIPITWGIILFDGLIQLSIFQREILSLWACLTVIIVFSQLEPDSKTSENPKKLLQIFIMLLFAVPFPLLYIIPQFKSSIYEDSAVSFWKEGNFKESLKDYSKAIIYQPTNPSLYIGRSRMYLETGNKNAARIDAENAVKIQPLSASAFNNLSEIYLATNAKEQALEAIDTALTLYPYKADYHYHRSKILQIIGNITEVQEEAELATKYGKGLPGYATYSNHLKTLTINEKVTIP